MVVRIALMKLMASSLTGSSVSRPTSATINHDAPWWRAYSSTLVSNTAVVAARLPR